MSERPPVRQWCHCFSFENLFGDDVSIRRGTPSKGALRGSRVVAGEGKSNENGQPLPYQIEALLVDYGTPERAFHTYILGQIRRSEYSLVEDEFEGGIRRFCLITFLGPDHEHALEWLLESNLEVYLRAPILQWRRKERCQWVSIAVRDDQE